MSQIPQLMSGRALEHGIAMAVDHGGTNSAKMYVGGQANADVAAGTSFGGAGATTEGEMSEYTIPANSLVAGSTIRVRFCTSTTAIAGGTDNLTLNLRFGSNTTASSNQSLGINTATDQDATTDYCIGDFIIQIRTAGSSGTYIAWGTMTVSDTSAAASGNAPLTKFSGATAIAIDTTVANYLSVTGLWGNTDANAATTQGFVVDIVNPST